LYVSIQHTTDGGGLTLAGCQVPCKPLYQSPSQQDRGEENTMGKCMD